MKSRKIQIQRVLSTDAKLFINTNGNLLAQNPHAKTPLSLSHIQRVRIENSSITTTIGIVTGMTEYDLFEMMAEMSVAWLIQYLTPKTVVQDKCSIDTETDVYNLLEQKEVRGWWANEHRIRDAGLISMLCDYHSVVFNHARKHKKYSKNDSKLFAQDRTRDKYKRLHEMCMDKRFYHYQKLESSYARIW